MKKSILLFFLLLVTITSFSQVKEIKMNTFGQFEIFIEVGERGYVVIDMHGFVLETNVYERLSYYSDFHSYEAGRLKYVGDLYFSYYSDFHSYERGKIKRIGNLDFTYYSDFHDYESGKIKRIGRTDFTYYSDFHDYESGKIKRINSEYYSYESGVGMSNRKGELKSGASSFEQDGILFRIRNSSRRHRY